MELTYVKATKKNKRSTNLWFLHLTHEEGIAMIRSLAAQIDTKDPNTERLERFTLDGSTDVSISVSPSVVETQLRNEIHKLKEQNKTTLLRSWSIVPKGRKKANQKEPKNGKS